jgi:beta-mannosidase
VHFWEVWHGGKSFVAYRNIHGFVSEFGFQARPAPRTVASFTAPEDRADVDSPVMKYHMRSNRMYMDAKEDSKIGTDKILNIVRMYFGEPKDFESALWLSQITQAYGIEFGARGWRAAWSRPAGIRRSPSPRAGVSASQRWTWPMC